ncbi:hypothetical protein N7493_010772 [Penicillium malachiteum]|uniref:Amidase domain-containing protein n=1 Tax=Penicillium malachiteum TaxID=1324776 RepID=A0AAD6HDM8_9EURO|nr:hypothetical protein N7493_010772 [Penicillium malachiteum]
MALCTLAKKVPRIDVLRAIAGDLRALLDAGDVSSVDLVKAYLAQIHLHNHAGLSLHAIIAEQRSGPKSRLHGIPLLIKDQFCAPTLKLPTTGGSLAVKGLEAKEDSVLAIILKEADSLVIGTTNLSIFKELGNIKGYNITGGWSPVGGQTQSPYIKGGVDPNGKWLGHTVSLVAPIVGLRPYTAARSGGCTIDPSFSNHPR